MSKSDWSVKNIPDQTGRVVIITGSTSGIGKAGTKILAQKNAKVIMAVRNVAKGEAVVQEIRSSLQKADIEVRKLDLSDLDSVRAFSKGVINDYEHLDILINNAGIMLCPFSRTKNGFEIQMGTNHLGHFALTGLLMPLLKKTKGSRIVSTSSAGHRVANIKLEDINWEKRKYKTNIAYADSKIANLYFAYELARRLEGEPNAPVVTASHPGWTRSELQRHSGVLRFLNIFFSQGPEQGILPSLRGAIDPNAKSGDYYGPSRFFEMHGSPVKVKSNKRSYDTEAARKLWEISEELTQVSY